MTAAGETVRVARVSHLVEHPGYGDGELVDAQPVDLGLPPTARRSKGRDTRRGDVAGDIGPGIGGAAESVSPSHLAGKWQEEVVSTISAYREATDFAAFYSEHSQSVLVYLARRTFDPELAMELTAETFAQALSAKSQFRGQSTSDERAWLFGIARHVLLRTLRRSRAENRAMRRLRLERPVLDAEDAAQIVDQAELAQLRLSLDVELSALPEAQRDAIRLRVVEELPYDQVARRLGISATSARKRVSRGLAALALALDPLHTIGVSSMHDRTKIHALEQLGRDLERVLPRAEHHSRGRGARTAMIAAGVVAVVAAPALATSDVFDFGGNTPAAGEPGGPPAVVSTPKKPTIDVIATLIQPEGEAVLRDRVQPYGFKVQMQERPVAPEAAGRIFGVQYPRRARFDAMNHLVPDRQYNGTILVSIGRASTSQSDSTAGLSLYEVLPDVEAAINSDDPRATLKRLRELGFTVAVKFVVDNPDRSATARTGVKTVAVPPLGTVVLSILNADGSNTATPQTRSLIMEVAPKNSAVARDHP